MIVRADGGSPGNLHSARGVYADWCERQELQTHALRYAFAHGQYRAYRAQGFSHRETLAALSKGLGHGDGRDRWVKMVYLRGMDTAEFD